MIDRLLHPVMGWVLRYADPWERVAFSPPHELFGAGSERDFRWYLEGPSTVQVRTVEDVCKWLGDCAYPVEPAEEIIRCPRTWPHPSELEARRVGTCLDHALWAWRKLVELGYDADFVVGRLVKSASPTFRHAWVLFPEGGTTYLLETLAADSSAMVRPLTQVRADYVPELGADRLGRTFTFAAYTRRVWAAKENAAPSLRIDETR